MSGFFVNEMPFVTFYWLARLDVAGHRPGRHRLAGRLGGVRGGRRGHGRARGGRVAGAAGRPGDRQRHEPRDSVRIGAATSTPRWPRGFAADFRSPASCSGRSSFAVATSSEWRTSATATRCERTCSMCTAIVPIRRAVPTLIHLHGGAFVSGRKNSEARPLIYRLASQGWLCISANYRLSPAATFPDHLIDVKKVIAWVREHGHEYGADPAVVFVAGSSAGAHLAALAALTPNDPAFQPGLRTCRHLSHGRNRPLRLLRPARRRTGVPPRHLWRTSDPVPRRSSSRTATGTRGCLWRMRDRSSRGCGAPRHVRLSTPSCPGRCTRSTCSIPFASKPSSMRSRHSPPG